MISIICAIARNNVIGNNNSMIWHIPSDLKRFKSITSGSTIIMGRKTFESLPGVLPKRKHIVITRDKNYTVNNESVEVLHSVDEVLKKYENNNEEVFIIGGGQIYKEFLPHADKLYLTILEKDFKGDTKFPEINKDEWIIEEKSEIITENNIDYYFIDLKRK